MEHARGSHARRAASESALISAAARRPDSIAPFMNPCYCTLVCSPANTNRPAGRASHAHKAGSNFGSNTAYPPRAHSESSQVNVFDDRSDARARPRLRQRQNGFSNWSSIRVESSVVFMSEA